MGKNTSQGLQKYDNLKNNRISNRSSKHPITYTNKRANSLHTLLKNWIRKKHFLRDILDTRKSTNVPTHQIADLSSSIKWL